LVVGPRGTGKTTFLLEKAKQSKLLYLSADSPLISNIGLWELGRQAFQRDFNGIIFDEVHFAPDWSRDLKALYDAYPKKQIIASDSNSLILQKGIADLSRRFIKFTIPLLSFRDYVYIKYEITLPTIDILKPDISVLQKILDSGPVLNWFKEYLNAGMRPFFLENNYRERQLNIIEKTVFSDLPCFLPQTNENILRLGNAVVGMLALASIPTINVESTCREWSVGKETFYNLLAALEALQLIRIVDYRKSTKAKTKGAKILLVDPSHYSVLGGNIGNMREAYVAFELQERFGEVFASKDEEKGDFLSQGILFEVGGASKKAKKSDYVIRDDREQFTTGKIPLWTLGLR
jgi:predicted AAA+ superfamily ATPase